MLVFIIYFIHSHGIQTRYKLKSLLIDNKVIQPSDQLSNQHHIQYQIINYLAGPRSPVTIVIGNATNCIFYNNPILQLYISLQLCANSWGRQWGEDGYFRILRGVNESEIESFILGVWGKVNGRELRRHNRRMLLRHRLRHNRMGRLRHRRHLTRTS